MNKLQTLYYDPQQKLSVNQLSTGFDHVLVIDNPQDEQGLISTGWSDLVVEAWARPDLTFLLIITNLNVDQQQLWGQMQPLLKRNLLGCSDQAVAITNGDFYAKLVAGGCDPDHFYLPPNLAIKAITTKMIAQNQWMDWKIVNGTNFKNNSSSYAKI